MTTYLVFGSSAYSTSLPNFSLILPPPTIGLDPMPTKIPTEVQLTEFITKLHGWQVDIAATTYAGICTEFRNKVKSRIFAAGAPLLLSAGNPIVDVYVNNSRESGESDVWRDADGIAIHPVTNSNYLTQGPINIGIAPHPNPNQNPQTLQNALYWAFADVVARNI
jgi:hypothetical protein